MAKLSSIAVNVQAQEEGEERDHPYFDGVKVKVRSIHCAAYRRRRTSLMNRLPRRQRKLGDAVEQQERIDRQALAECVTGWNFEDVEFSPEMAREMADDPQYRKFWDGVRELAEEIGEGDAEAEAETAQD